MTALALAALGAGPAAADGTAAEEAPHQLKDWELALIIVGSILGAVLLTLLAVYLYNKYRK